MNKTSLFLSVAVILTLAVSIAGIVLPKQVVIDQFGNATASFWDASSYKISGTEVIGSSRDISATTIGATGISSLATTTATKLCVYNGTSYTILTFSNTSTSTNAFTTSSVCQ